MPRRGWSGSRKPTSWAVTSSSTGKTEFGPLLRGRGVSFAEWFATPLGRKVQAMSYSPLRPDSQRVEAALMIAATSLSICLGPRPCARRKCSSRTSIASHDGATGGLDAHESTSRSQRRSPSDAGLLWLGARPTNLERSGSPWRHHQGRHRAGKVIDRYSRPRQEGASANDQLTSTDCSRSHRPDT